MLRGSHPLLERLLTIVLMVIFVASFLAYLAIQVMTEDVLNARFYTRALERNRIYDRIYTDLLADPALRDVTVQLLGNLRIEGTYSRETYSYTVSALRLVLPPDVLRSAADRLFTELTAYLSGNRQRLRSNINLSKAINDPELQQKIIAGAQTVQTELIARARQNRLISEDELSVPVLTPETLYRQLEDYVRALAEGRLGALPFDITNLSIRGLSDAQKHEIARILLAPAGERVTNATRLQVEVALADNDLAGAIVIASGELLAVQAEEAAHNLQTELKTGTIGGVDAFARLADKKTATIISELNDTRELAHLFRHDLMLVVILALIQVGGIGYMTFGSFVVLSGRGQLSERREQIGKVVFSMPEEFRIAKFIRSVIFFTVAVETAGVAALFAAFRGAGLEHPLWWAVFHSVSAFCTAGFGLSDVSFEALRGNVAAADDGVVVLSLIHI